MAKSNTASFLWGVLLFVGLVLAIGVQAQVNFSPAWGKRGPGPVSMQSARGGDLTDHFSQNLADCKLPFEGVVRVLKLIQVEAQRILRCEGSMPPDSTD